MSDITVLAAPAPCSFAEIRRRAVPVLRRAGVMRAETPVGSCSDHPPRPSLTPRNSLANLGSSGRSAIALS